jgi:hypothetical protein
MWDPPAHAFQGERLMTRDYRARYLRDKQLAAERGFGSVRTMRSTERIPRNASAYFRLPEEARESRAEVDAVLRIARRDRVPVEVVLADRQFSLATMRWWFPGALKPTRRVTTADRHLRIRTFIGDGERRFVPLRGSRAAHLAEEANAIQWRFVHGNASPDDLGRLHDLRLAGYGVDADPGVLVAIARRGEFDPAEIYRELV